jgi:hypothetical protein
VTADLDYLFFHEHIDTVLNVSLRPNSSATVKFTKRFLLF